jgi:hypothetical protein
VRCLTDCLSVGVNDEQKAAVGVAYQRSNTQAPDQAGDADGSTGDEAGASLAGVTPLVALISAVCIEAV